VPGASDSDCIQSHLSQILDWHFLLPNPLPTFPKFLIASCYLRLTMYDDSQRTTKQKYILEWDVSLRLLESNRID
jgi:hypothetical protein